MRIWVQKNINSGLPKLPVLAIVNSGGLRWTTDIYPGTNLTKGDILNLLPFGNLVAVILTSGSILKAALENSVSILPDGFGGFLQISGFTFTHDCYVVSWGIGNCSSPSGSRVVNVTYPDGTPIKDNDMFYLAMPDYMQQGGNAYTMFTDQQIIIDPENSVTIFDAVLEYVQNIFYISPKVEGRIKERDQPPSRKENLIPVL